MKFGSRLILLNFCLSVALTLQAEDDRCESEQGVVARAMFTTDIDDREPVDRVLILKNNFPQLYFFSDLRHLQGQSVKHRWEYEGRVVKEKVFQVQGPRWRVYSLNKMDKSMTGRWTVVITDENDCPLKVVIFQYIKSDQGENSAIIDLR